jgi:hypothetical protein
MPIDPQMNQTPLPRMAGKVLSQDPSTRRRYAYDIEEQLNFLYDDIQAGAFGEAAKSGKFASYVAGIKDQFPKS